MGGLSYLSVDASVARADGHLRQAVGPFALGTLAVLGVGAAHSDYFPASWGWAIVTFVALLSWPLAVGAARRPSTLEGMFLLALVLLACWFALSAIWGTPAAALDESVRVIVYVAGACFATSIMRRTTVAALLAGVLVGSITLAAIFVVLALSASARNDDEREASLLLLRYSALVVALAIAAVGFVLLVGNIFLSRASAAASNAKWAIAVREAHRAASWLPWSTQPWEQLGEAELARGNVATAQVSFRKAIAKDDGDWNLWFDLARATSDKTQHAALAHATKPNPLSPKIATFSSDLNAQPGISIAAAGAKH